MLAAGLHSSESASNDRANRLAAKGITYITISHRPVLRSFHLKMLCIHGDKEKSYKYEDLQTRDELATHVDQGLKRHAELK